MFSVFSVFTQTNKNKSIVNLYQKELLGYLSEDTKWGHLIMCWIGKPVTGCYTTYILIVWADVPMLFWVHYSSQKISENETALNCGFGFAIANPIKAADFKAVSLIKACVIM